MSVTPGARIGAYEIVELLGAGGMGEVYRARDLRLPRDVALKVLPASLAFDADRRTRFDREARMLASLNHPNIATLYGVEDSPAGTVLVMELVDGETLADRIALHDGEYVIGRDAACDICLDDASVSRRHARIVIEGTAVRLEDLGSKNGTTCGGGVVRGQIVLTADDRLEFGSVVAVYRSSESGMSTETRSRSNLDRRESARS